MRKREGKTDLQLQIDAALKTEIIAQAKAEDRSLTAFVTRALQLYLKRTDLGQEI
jgi:hypothetical protein